VILKGCPLRCTWCDTPEGHRTEPELVFRQEQCVRCFECFDDCRLGAISASGGQPVVDLNVCRWCGDCADGCSTDARRQAGSVMTESRVLAEVLRDEALYRQSGGGVTFSGGEPLLQPDFLLRLLETCRERGIHTAVDTCGASPAGVLDRVADLADLFLYDLKHLDDGEHRRMTGASNREILDNLRMLARRQAPVRVRFPVIPGVNDAAAHVRRLGEFVSSLGFREIDVVPYRKPVPGVYEALGRPNSSMALQEPQATVIAEVMQRLSGCGLTAHVAPRRV
jgi:pyruvate formate lyase activating enzyme